MSVVAIIPARYASTRFPGKPLARIGGKPMVQHVYENTSKVPGLSRVLVATDDRRIFQTVKGFGGEAVLTSKTHSSGTDRLAEVAKKITDQWIINVQGDLPFVRIQTISRTLRAVVDHPSILMGTARTPIVSKEEFYSPHVVKVVTDAYGFALYFSRAPIPYPMRDFSRAEERGFPWGYRHIGIYIYQREFLLKIHRLRSVFLEKIEGLEQLRTLAHGYRIRVADVNEPSVEVDTPKDLKKAEKYLRGLEKSKYHGKRQN